LISRVVNWSTHLLLLIVHGVNASTSCDAFPGKAMLCFCSLFREALDVFVQSLARSASESTVTSEHGSCKYPREEFFHLDLPIFVRIDGL
jgi:hypothetical protein